MLVRGGSDCGKRVLATTKDLSYKGCGTHEASVYPGPHYARGRNYLNGMRLRGREPDGTPTHKRRNGCHAKGDAFVHLGPWCTPDFSWFMADSAPRCLDRSCFFCGPRRRRCPHAAVGDEPGKRALAWSPDHRSVALSRVRRVSCLRLLDRLSNSNGAPPWRKSSCARRHRRVYRLRLLHGHRSYYRASNHCRRWPCYFLLSRQHLLCSDSCCCDRTRNVQRIPANPVAHCRSARYPLWQSLDRDFR